jgi:NADPH2:quinone reductase
VYAAMVQDFGPPEVLRTVEVPDPVPGPGEALVDVAAADVLWVETAVRGGEGTDWFPHRPPYVPGNGVAGTVTAVGDGVDPGWVGRTVAGHTGNLGGYAERAAIPVERLVPVPDGVSAEQAAALLHDGPTALALFDHLRVGAGDAVHVGGASGGLGLLSVQLARRRADRVVAVARDPAKIARIRALGPDAVVDSDDADWPAAARAALPPAGADVVLDNVGGPLGRPALDLVAPGGRHSAHGTPAGGFAVVDENEARRRGITSSGIEVVQMSPDRLTEHLRRALDAAADGTLHPVIGQSFPLDRAADAHAAIEARTVFGKTLLTAGTVPPQR